MGNMTNLLQDLRFAFRRLHRRPGFSLVFVIIVALGIGANGAVFSLVEAVLLRPLPFADPERLADLSMVDRRLDAESAVSLPDVEDWKEASAGFESLAAYQTGRVVLSAGGAAHQLTSARVQEEFFPLLGVEPLRGHHWSADDLSADQAAPVLISERVWREHLGAVPSLEGESVTLDGRPRTVVGVMPSSFRFPWRDGRGVDVWMLLGTTDDLQERGDRSYRCVGRLSPGVSLDQARNAMEAVAERLAREHPDTNSNHRLQVVDLHSKLRGEFRTPLWTALAAVGLVLLAACSNLAQLNLAQSSTRQGELSLRNALGASRGRLLRQMILEGLPLCLLGGLAGVWAAALSLGWMTDRLPEPAPPQGLALNLSVVLFCLAATGATVLLTGALPAWWASRRLGGHQSLQGVSRGSSGSRGALSAQGMLILVQAALAAMPAVGAALLLRSESMLQRVDPGFRSRDVLAVGLSLPRYAYADESRQSAYLQQALEGVRRLPGVTSAGAILNLPLRGGEYTTSMAIEKRSFGQDERPVVEFQLLSPGYFETLGIPLLSGRLPTSGDGVGAPEAVWINQTMARRWWPAEDPVGRRINLTGFEGPEKWATIMGVVADVRHHGLRVPARPEAYRPYAQYPARLITLAVRTSLPPLSLAASLRSRLQRVDAQVPVQWVESLGTIVDSSISQVRLTGRLLTAFAAAALLLGALGIYGVLSFFIAGRRGEIGLRMALGAQRGRICRLALMRGMRPAAAGAAFGLASALVLTQWMQSLLFQVSSWDPASYLAVAAVLLSVALPACLLPALSAARVDPSTALRSE